jgi:hypothetical protein
MLSLLAVAAVLGAVPSSGLADHEPDLGTEAMTILVPGYSQGYTESTLDSGPMTILVRGFNQGHNWDHADLTVQIRAAENVDEATITAVRDGISIWNTAITHRHGEGVVRFREVAGDSVDDAGPDIVVDLNEEGGIRVGRAGCQSGSHCQVQTWDDERPKRIDWRVEDFSRDELVAFVVHQLGHSLGLGHAVPRMGTPDVMSYGGAGVPFPPAVISDCNMDAFDVIWAWAIDGEKPYAPNVSQVPCD